MTDINEVLEERGKTHGYWMEQSVFSQGLKEMLLKRPLAAYQLEALEMICVKISRIMCGNPDEPDHWKDIAGYATLVAKELESKR